MYIIRIAELLSLNCVDNLPFVYGYTVVGDE